MPNHDEQSGGRKPRVSVVMPTYKRIDLLPRAIQSVMEQTFADWELVISDDEEPAGETWRYLQTLTDPRIRITRNPGKHGQSGNVNHALREARGEWIKPLYDDDRIRPDCLKALVEGVDKAAAAGCDIILAACNLAEYRSGVMTKSGERDGPRFVVATKAHSPEFSLRGQPVPGGVPSQLFVHRRAIEAGIMFEQPSQLVSGVDAYWVMRLRSLGDCLIVNEPLAELHQGEHDTVSSSMSDVALDREFDYLVCEQYERRDPSLPLPGLSYFRQSTRITRAAHRWRKGKYLDALRLALTCWRPDAWVAGLKRVSALRGPSLTLTPHHRVLPS